MTWYRAACLSAAGVVFVALLSTQADALERRLTVINETSFAIVALYGSRIGSSDWHANVLGDETLLAGASREVVFDASQGYCMFNLRAVFEDKDVVVTKEPVNVCDENAFYYRE